MFIDADIGFEPELVGRFLTMDEDLVAGLYPVKGLDWSGIARACAGGQASVEQAREAGLHFVGTPLTGAEREEREGFVTGKYAGTGFLMIRRSAVERMAEAYPELHYRCAHVHPAPGRVSEHLFDLFAPLIEPDTRTYLSEDYSFCHRWRAIGGKLWLDATARLKHVGGYEFQGTPPLELARVDLPRCA
jgi:hypothetical protein